MHPAWSTQSTHAPPPQLSATCMHVGFVAALQWPGLLRPLSPALFDLPAMVQEKYRTCQTMCFCGLFPAIKRAWASVDNSLFLWRYDRRYVMKG